MQIIYIYNLYNIIYVYCLLEMISRVGCLLHVDDQKSPQPKVFSSSRNIIWHGLSLTNNHVGSWAAPDGYRERKMGHHPQSRTKIAHACVFPKQNQANNIRHHNFMLHLRFFWGCPFFNQKLHGKSIFLRGLVFPHPAYRGGCWQTWCHDERPLGIASVKKGFLLSAMFHGEKMNPRSSCIPSGKLT